MANLWAKGSKLSFLAVVISAILLGAFKTVFPEIETKEVLGVIVLVALGLAVLANYLWGRWQKLKEPGQGKE